MPKLPQPIISTAWRYGNEPTKIHYRAIRVNGTLQHGIVREGDPLYRLLNDHLLAIGYTGPASAAEAEESEEDDPEDDH